MRVLQKSGKGNQEEIKSILHCLHLSDKTARLYIKLCITYFAYLLTFCLHLIKTFNVLFLINVMCHILIYKFCNFLDILFQLFDVNMTQKHSY